MNILKGFRFFLFIVCFLCFSAQAQSWVASGTRAHPIHDATVRGNLANDEQIDITVVLKLRNRDQLDKVIHSLNQPGEVTYRHWLSPKQIETDYAPRHDSAQSVADYLTHSGFTNIQIEPGNLLISATGSARAVRQAFNTELAHVQRHGHDGIANTRDVQLPAELSDSVLSVLGLQTVDVLRPMLKPAVSVQLTGSVHGINPVNFPYLYHAVDLPSASTVAVGTITEGVMTQTIIDLLTFQTNNGLPIITPEVVNAFTGTTSDTSGTGEWNLDSQTIQAMAGGQVSQMIFYTAKSFTSANITKALNRAVKDNTVSVINVSLGICESYAQADGSMAADDQIFRLALAQGQTFSVSSGDSGSKECGNPVGTAVGAAYPASSPYVVAVGGTTLYSDATSRLYGGETVWSGTGGSPSLIEPRPIWQNGVVTGTYRGLPDIAFDANPNSGAVIILNGANVQYGGTSLASPLFVGSWARIQAANKARLGFPVTWIYSHGSQGTSAFHDVTSGSNGDYSAATGWDFTTGFGSFDVAATALLTRSTVMVSASSATVVTGQPITLTATVTGNNPTGTIQFLVNGIAFGVPITLVNGIATLTTNQLTVTGIDVISVVYSGDLNNAGITSSATFALTVTPPHDGDINNDGVVNAADILLVERIALNMLTPNTDQFAHADVAPLLNGVPAPDGEINAADMLIIERKALGAINY